MIAIVDSGAGNIGSVIHALKRIGVAANLTADKKLIENASHVILPGVGAAAHVMKNLAELDLITTLKNLQQPTLGICLGMQLLYEFSSEGNVDCLAIIPGQIKRFEPQEKLAVPHMGWNSLKLMQEHHLFQGLSANSYFYFVHSYIAPLNEYTLAKADYGQAFAAVVQYKNYYGMQFHPERSGTTGSLLLENFLRL